MSDFSCPECGGYELERTVEQEVHEYNRWDCPCGHSLDANARWSISCPDPDCHSLTVIPDLMEVDCRGCGSSLIRKYGNVWELQNDIQMLGPASMTA